MSALDALPERFRSKVSIDAATGCWNWTARTGYRGYGRYQGSPAHRVAYEALVGSIPAGLQLHHECFNPSCVNPEHVVPLTPKEHGQRHVRNECRRGHPFTPENTKMVAPGVRTCLTCFRADSTTKHRWDRELHAKRAERMAVVGGAHA